MAVALRRIAFWVAVGLLVALYAFQGGAKLTGQQFEKDAFTQRWGYPLWFMYVVGTLEVAAVVGLLVPFLRPWAAAGLVGLMIGATATHIRVGEWSFLPVPVGAGLLAAWVAWEERARFPFWRRRATENPGRTV